MHKILSDIAQCQICADRFAATKTAHSPRPVLQAGPKARILIAGQAPGARVHASGRPFTDRSGERLRDWLGVSKDAFYDPDLFAIVPMAFCFPGYSATGSDLPPPPVCARTWRAAVLAKLDAVRLTVLVGGHALRWHLGPGPGVAQRVAAWRDHAPDVFAVPHPSWRNSGWLARHPWFDTALVPALRARVKEVLDAG